jgi:hypothetical protein
VDRNGGADMHLNHQLKNKLDLVILTGRPASGKSEVIAYLKYTSDQKLIGPALDDVFLRLRSVRDRNMEIEYESEMVKR